jgi:hypothetical protein
MLYFSDNFSFLFWLLQLFGVFDMTGFFPGSFGLFDDILWFNFMPFVDLVSLAII